MSPANDEILEEMEQELEQIKYLAIAAMVVLSCVGMFAWLVL